MIPEPFRCDVSYRPNSWLLALFGELDVAALPECEAAIRLVRGGPESVTLDLRGLTFMDSTGVTLIVKLGALAQEDGFDLILVRGSETVQRTLVLSGLDVRLDMLDAPDPLPEADEAPEYAVITTDLDGIVTRWNAEAERLYGWSREEVSGRPITELTVGPQDVDLAEEIMESVRRSGAWMGEFDVRRKDGSRFAAQVRTTLIKDEDGRAVGLAGISIAASRIASALA
jgi:anti-sigma B factor antagonist